MTPSAAPPPLHAAHGTGSPTTNVHGTVTGLVDLAARRLGGLVVAVSDEFFAPADALLDPLPPVFDAAAFGPRGKVMDGWESRRRRSSGSDDVVVRLGVAGVVAAVVVDTRHFTGNHPEAFELHGTVSDADVPAADAVWVPLLGRTALRGDAAQRFDVAADLRVTHVRLDIHPDGGVARLRVLGRPVVDLHGVADPDDRLDLAATTSGGWAVGCSDAFYSAPANLLMVGDARDMGDGWENRRRRDDGHDWVVVALATAGVVERIELDTTHFRGNFPDRCRIDVVHAPGVDDDGVPEGAWTTIVPETPLRPHARHVFDAVAQVEATHLRLAVLPDGGVARLRARGRVTEEGWRTHGVRLLDTSAAVAAAEVLRACCASAAWVEAMVAARPFGSPGALLAVADEVWAGLTDDDHREAFAAHPRIGERSDSAWSTREQAGAAGAQDGVLERIAEGNVAYEARFGHVYLVRAAGRSAEELLALLEERLGNDPAAELVVAAGQQAEITRLRLERWLREGSIG
jgi:allantoicase